MRHTAFRFRPHPRVISFNNRETELLGERQHAMTGGGLGVGAGGVVQQRLGEEGSRPVGATSTLESFQIGAGGVARDRDEIDVLPPELLEQHEITGVFDKYRIAG